MPGGVPGGVPDDGRVVSRDVLPLSVHGPAGVVDLLVPAEATCADVAREYAVQTGSRGVPALCTPSGHPLPAASSLGEAGVVLGSVVVAVADARAVAPPREHTGEHTGEHVPGRAGETGLDRSGSGSARAHPAGAVSRAGSPVPWCTAAAAGAVLAGLLGARLDAGSAERTVVLVALVVATVVGVLPLGRLLGPRTLTAPAFAGAAAYVVAYDPLPERTPIVLGIAALAAAVVAAVGRSLGPAGIEEGTRVQILAGAGVFGLTTLAAVTDLDAAVVWSVLVATAMLAARLVPVVAVDVPDQYLIDLERLAVTAWSARERPTGRRGRTIVPQAAMEVVAARGTRLLTASSAAVLVVATVAAQQLLARTPTGTDAIGSRVLVLLAGVALLLAARSYRHRGARTLLRLAGLGCVAQAAAVLLGLLGSAGLVLVALASIAAGALVVVAAVAAGRGWRSAWWARRAEVAEGVVGAVALAAVVVSTGAFRSLWETASARFGS